MREIKFRAWDKQDRRMILDPQDFIPLRVTNIGVLRLSPIHEGEMYQILDPSRFELMQFTGLLDKNGREIYEGDIFQVAGNRVYIVAYCIQEEGDSELYYATFILRGADERATVFPLDEYAMKTGEIIGNIHESPELLK